VLKLNLGCGNDYMIGYLNCDVTDKLKIDQIVNLELPLRFNDNSVDEIIIYHTLEHVHNFIPLMEELHRISKDGTIIKVKVPYFASASAFKLRTFNYFDPEHWYSYYSKARFTVVSSKLNFIVSRPMLSKCVGLFINSFPRLYEKFISRILPAEELETHLVVKKSF